MNLLLEASHVQHGVVTAAKNIVRSLLQYSTDGQSQCTSDQGLLHMLRHVILRSGSLSPTM
jgi:hypothetical protein